MFHAQCGVMLGRMEGLEFINTTSMRSTKPSQIVKDQWRDNDYMWKSFFTDPPGQHLEYQCRLFCRIEVTKSSLVVSEIQEAMKSAENDHYHWPEPVLSVIPLELKILIAEDICPITKYTTSDVGNLKSMLFASRWELPESF